MFIGARDAQGAGHLSAWRAFNQAIGADGSVGVWHQTYHIAPGRYQNIYVNMPPFGLGKAGSLAGASGARESASARLDANTAGP